MKSQLTFSAALVSIALVTAGCSAAQENAGVPDTSATPSAATQSAAPSTVANDPATDSSVEHLKNNADVQALLSAFESEAQYTTVNRNRLVSEMVNSPIRDGNNHLTKDQARELVNMANIDWNQEAIEVVEDLKRTPRTVDEFNNAARQLLSEFGFTEEEINQAIEQTQI